MIPITVIPGRGSKKSPEDRADASERRQKARESAADARRFVNPVSVAAMIALTAC